VKYLEFREQSSFSQQDLLGFAHGTLFDDAPIGFGARLPLPPMLMVDRILNIERSGSRGSIVAERDVRVDDWFFQCHFLSDPVQPGCLGVDGVWQLLGFYCAWAGGLGAGRALGCGEVEFFGQIRPYDKCVRYEIDVRRYTELERVGAAMVIGNAKLFVDDELIYLVNKARVGTFQGIAYPDYPNRSQNAVGGKLDR